MNTKIFVNKSKEFFGKLGFTFNLIFTDDNAACMVISEENYAMLLTKAFFKNFIPGREICDRLQEGKVDQSLKCAVPVPSISRPKPAAANDTEPKNASGADGGGAFGGWL